jgi:hypothetical protein
MALNGPCYSRSAIGELPSTRIGTVFAGPGTDTGNDDVLGMPAGSASNRRDAPYCGHDFTAVNVRGDRDVAIALSNDLRAAYGGYYYVSEPYEADGNWAIALCRACAQQPGSSGT